MSTTSISVEVGVLVDLFKSIDIPVDKKAEAEDEVAYNAYLKSSSNGDEVYLSGATSSGEVTGVKTVDALFGAIGPVIFPAVKIKLIISALSGYKKDDILNLVVEDDVLGISETNPSEADTSGEDILYIVRIPVESGKNLSTISIFNKIASRKDSEEFTLRIDPARLELLVKVAKANKSDINLHFSDAEKAIQVNIGETWRGYVTPYEEAGNPEDFDKTSV